MTIEEMEDMNIKEVAQRFLSNKCGTCNNCEFADITILIGNSHVTLCHLIYSILREDRKQDKAIKMIQPSTTHGILGKV